MPKGKKGFQPGKENPSVVLQTARQYADTSKRVDLPEIMAQCKVVAELAASVRDAGNISMDSLQTLLMYAFATDEVDGLLHYLAPKSKQKKRLRTRAATFVANQLAAPHSPEDISSKGSPEILKRVRALQAWSVVNPGLCSTKADIVRHFPYPEGTDNRLSLSKVRKVMKRAAEIGEPFAVKKVGRQPKLMTASNAEAYIQYLQSLTQLPADSLCLFYDQFPISTEAGKGASSAQKVTHEIIAPHGVSSVTSEGRRSAGKTFQVSILIWKDKIIKVWPHGLTKGEAGINKQGGTMDGSAVEYFFTQQQAVPEELLTLLQREYKCSAELIGGDPIPELLAREKLQRTLIFADCLGRGGVSDRPMTAHFNANLVAYLARRGITWVLLPPAGCEGNPVEMINGEIQRKVAYASPDEALPKTDASSATRVGGPTCRPQMVHLMNLACQEINTRDKKLWGCYELRADGRRMKERLSEAAAGAAVIALRAHRTAIGKRNPQRQIFAVSDRRVFQGYRTNKQHDLQALQELLLEPTTQPDAVKCQIVPWVTSTHPFSMCLIAIDLLNGCCTKQRAKQMLRELKTVEIPDSEDHQRIVQLLQQEAELQQTRTVSDTPSNGRIILRLRGGGVCGVKLATLDAEDRSITFQRLAEVLTDLFPDTQVSDEALDREDVALATGYVHHDPKVVERVKKNTSKEAAAANAADIPKQGGVKRSSSSVASVDVQPKARRSRRGSASGK